MRLYKAQGIPPCKISVPHGSRIGRLNLGSGEPQGLSSCEVNALTCKNADTVRRAHDGRLLIVVLKLHCSACRVADTITDTAGFSARSHLLDNLFSAEIPLSWRGRLCLGRECVAFVAEVHGGPASRLGLARAVTK